MALLDRIPDRPDAKFATAERHYRQATEHGELLAENAELHTRLYEAELELDRVRGQSRRVTLWTCLAYLAVGWGLGLVSAWRGME